MKSLLALLLCALSAHAATIGLAWDANVATDNVTSYRLYEAVGTNAFALVAVTQSPAAAVSGLTNGITYRFFVTAVNAIGESQPSNTVTNTLNSVPGAPTNLRVTAMSATRLDLQWDSDLNASTKIERDYKNRGQFVALASVGPSVQSFIDATCQPRTTYAYRTRAVNDAGSSPYSGVALGRTLNH